MCVLCVFGWFLSLFMWVQPEITQKLYIGLWMTFITSCLLPYKLVGFIVGESALQPHAKRHPSTVWSGGASPFHSKGTTRAQPTLSFSLLTTFVWACRLELLANEGVGGERPLKPN